MGQNEERKESVEARRRGYGGLLIALFWDKISRGVVGEIAAEGKKTPAGVTRRMIFNLRSPLLQ
jgi:hypothetical protein